MSMELFSIFCETCQAKLRVRQPEAIGQILECPRCSSMVQVIPPPGWQAEPDGPDERADELASDDPADGTTEDETTDQLIPIDAGQPDRLRTIWVMVAAATGVLAVVFGLAAVWQRSGATDSGHVTTAAPELRTPRATPDPSALAPPAAIGGDAPDPQPAPLPHAPDDPPSSATPPESPDEADPAASDAPLAGQGPTGSDSTPSVAPQPQPSSAPANRAAAPEGVESPTDDSPADAPQPADAPPAPAVAPTAQPAPDPREAAPPPTAVMQIEKRPDSASQALDVPARLADPVAQIDFDAIGIAALVDLLVEMTRLPITLDLNALERKGLRATDHVSIHLRRTTVGAILTDSLAQRGLVYTADDDQVVVTDSRVQRAAVRFRVGDLIAGDSPVERSAGLERLRGEIETLIWPTTWQANGGRGTIRVKDDLLEIDQSRAVLYEILVFCEKLRLARGLPQQSRFRQSRFPLASRTAQAREKLARPLTITFIEPTPLPEIVRSIQHSTGMAIAVDWRLLLPEGITPGAVVTCGVTERPLAEALSALFHPIGLDWRVVNAASIQLVTQAETAARLELEFYSVGENAETTGGPQALIERLREEVDSDSWAGAGGSGLAVYDAPSGHLIVLQTQPIQRQVEQWLSRLATPPNRR